MIENPPWVDRVLSENWTELERMIDPDLLPSTEVVGRRRRVAEGAEYGCGHYGCVMATGHPGIVCKATTDASEARFVEMGWERLGAPARTHETGWPEGIVQYHQILALTGSHRARPIWLLWRDEAWNVGDVWRLLSRASRDDGYDLREFRKGISRLGQFKFYASSARLMIEKTPAVLPEAVKLWQGNDLYDMVTGLFIDAEEGKRRWGDPHALERDARHFPQIPFAKVGLRGARRLAANLQAAQNVLEQMANEPGLYAIGQALETFMEHGMLLADVHHNNIGRSSPDVGVRDWVITDPGHLAVLW